MNNEKFAENSFSSHNEIVCFKRIRFVIVEIPSDRILNSDRF